jgi:cobaltochelatase CobN
MDVWGSATIRTGGEDLAVALLLMGAQPVWDQGSARVSGIEILPIAELDHPRLDVTLRISGLFRDAFEAQIALFDEAVRAIASRDEPDDWNPLAASARGLQGEALRRATARIYGAALGDYGAGVTERVERGAWDARADLGLDYLAASATASAMRRRSITPTSRAQTRRRCAPSWRKSPASCAAALPTPPGSKA